MTAITAGLEDRLDVARKINRSPGWGWQHRRRSVGRVCCHGGADQQLERDCKEKQTGHGRLAKPGGWQQIAEYRRATGCYLSRNRARRKGKTGRLQGRSWGRPRCL